MSKPEQPTAAANFIRHLIRDDIEQGKNAGRVGTRFPPEPNGYPHIGHAKSICLNFGTAQEFNGSCNLRFDDTNPEKENDEFVQAIAEDVQWLGFTWDNQFFASDYFERLFEFALALIEDGLAYVDDQSADEIRAQRGTLKEPGSNSPFRDRSIEENAQLFKAMRAGEFEDGSKVLRLKIDMASPNINMRDPVIYRIRRAHHHRTGDAWCIYPMYDYTHCISDAIESITHSLCTLEFADHRPLYDWILDHIQIDNHPQQIEFARLALEYTVVSKRKLAALIEQGAVDGWDDPRMPTLRGMRRRGFTPASIRVFCERIGITKKDSWIEMGVLEDCIRSDLNQNAPRRMAVLDPIKVVLSNYPEDNAETLSLLNHPQREELGKRDVSFSKELYIEREDFAEVAPPKYKRLALGGEVRLRGSYVIRCDEVIKDDKGEIVELRCSVDMATLGVKPEGRKVKGVIHWVDAKTAVNAEVRVYDRLFSNPNPNAVDDFTSALNPESLVVMPNARLEASLRDAQTEDVFQFERMGYFCCDPDSNEKRPVFNRTVTLRDTWSS
ncbi:MAG: glutamine--tRNA ligase/YqeY domain fusion protein [Granulosicoccaceae bacterium]